MKEDILKVLLSEDDIAARVAEIGAQISRDYAGKRLVMVSVLKGSVVFMADLMRAVTVPAANRFYVRFKLWQRREDKRSRQNH